MTAGGGEGELRAIGAALQASFGTMLEELSLAGASSKDLSRELAIDHTTARRFTRMLGERDPLIALTRAPKPEAFMRVAAHARTRGLGDETFSGVRAAAARFNAAVRAAGSKAKLTSRVRSTDPAGGCGAGENLSADVA